MATPEFVTVVDKKKNNRTIRLSDIVQVIECANSGRKRGPWIVDLRVGKRFDIDSEEAAKILKAMGQ